MGNPKRPTPWDPLVDLDADEKDWPLGTGPDGELNVVRGDAPDEEECESDEHATPQEPRSK